MSKFDPLIGHLLVTSGARALVVLGPTHNSTWTMQTIADHLLERFLWFNKKLELCVDPMAIATSTMPEETRLNFPMPGNLGDRGIVILRWRYIGARDRLRGYAASTFWREKCVIMPADVMKMALTLAEHHERFPHYF